MIQIPKQAIEKAIEGGWQPQHPGTALRMVHENGFWLTDKVIGEHTYFIAKEKVALDPTFWRALAKASGWPKCVLRHYPHTSACEKWRNWAIYFCDLILTGQPTEPFWTDLLSK